MDSFNKLQELCLRLDSIEKTGEFLSEALEGKDEVVSQSGKLLVSLAEDVRLRALELVTELERHALSGTLLNSPEEAKLPKTPENILLN